MAGSWGALEAVKRAIAPAARGPNIDVKECLKRRDAGIGHRLVGNARTGSPSRSEAARTLCLALSLTVHSSWAMVCPAARQASRGGWAAQAGFRLGMAMGAVASVPGSRPEPEPPQRWRPRNLGCLLGEGKGLKICPGTPALP